MPFAGLVTVCLDGRMVHVVVTVNVVKVSDLNVLLSIMRS